MHACKHAGMFVPQHGTSLVALINAGQAQQRRKHPKRRRGKRTGTACCAALQIFELDSFRVTHASRYPAPVLSLGISPDARLLAVGMADGMLSIRKHLRPKKAAGGTAAAGQAGDERVYRRPAYVPRLTAANFRYFIRGQNARAAAEDYRVKARRKARLAPYDKLLRQFRCAPLRASAGLCWLAWR